MTFATLVIAVFAQTPASIQQIHRVFVSGNNPAAQSVRAGLLRQGEYWVKKGKQPCLILVSKPSEADATLDVNQASYHGVVTGTLTLKSGELVWSDEYSGHNMRILVGEEIAMDAKMTGDRLLVKLEKEVGVCKKGYRKDSETAKSPSEQQASSQPSTESASQPANQTTSASPPANTAVHKPTQALQAQGSPAQRQAGESRTGSPYFGAESSDIPRVRHNGVTLSRIDSYIGSSSRRPPATGSKSSPGRPASR